MWDGCAHTGGLYPNRSGAGDFFSYGANLVKALGFDTLKVYLSNGYANRDYINQTWGAAPTTLTELAQKTPIATALADAAFSRFVLSTFSIGQPDLAWATTGLTPTDLQAEYTQVYDLSVHLLSSHSGKQFILKNWEGDWQLLGGTGNKERNVPTGRIHLYQAYHRVRQKAVSDARNAVSSTSTIQYAIECNLVLDDFGPRVHRNVLPVIRPDMVSLSIYEATNYGWGSGEAAITTEISTRLPKIVSRIRAIYDPSIPIIIGEFGFPQDDSAFNSTSPDVGNLIATVRSVASGLGIQGCIWWQILDNEELSAGVPRGFGLYNRNGSSSTVGSLSSAGTKYSNLL